MTATPTKSKNIFNIFSYFSCSSINTNDVISLNEIIPTTSTNKPSKHINWEDTKPFVLPIDSGEVIKVYDGDTITIATRLPYDNAPLCPIYRFSVRLTGIDTPELKSHNEDEKNAAINARDALSKLILHKKVVLKNVSTEKYGRVLAIVYLDDININEWLLKERYALPYDGGTKLHPVSWIKYRLTGELI